MFMNLAKALIQHGRIITTEMKAKDLRGVVEPLISLAKRNDLHSRRLAYKELNDHRIVKYLFDEVGPLFAETPGGYTRVLKLADRRKGDNAPMAIIEFSLKKGETPQPKVKKERAPQPEKKDAAPAGTTGKEEKSGSAGTGEASSGVEKKIDSPAEKDAEPKAAADDAKPATESSEETPAPDSKSPDVASE